MSRVSPYPIFRSDSKEEISLLKIGSRTILDPHVIEVFSQQRSDKTNDCIERPAITAGVRNPLCEGIGRWRCISVRRGSQEPGRLEPFIK